MMKLNRFALVAGVLALGVAACGDDVQVVEPTPPQPPPPPPVTATMAPASASVAVGNSVVFAVNASGGTAGEAATWTCASSNTGIATVTSTSAGCSATGVAAGDVTITASVSKSGETVNVGAQLTVTSDEEPPQPPGDPAFILIRKITGTGGSDASGLNGRVSVEIGVERGDQELEELSVLLDDAVVASQSFGGGMDMGMASPEEAAEQAVHTFTLSFESDDYDRDNGTPVYMNGEYTISAELEIGVTMADGMHGHETVSSNAVPVEFKNSSFIATTVSGLGDGAINAVTGRMWYGGPDASVEISALPVLYSGSVSSVTLNQFCGAKAATDSEAPFSFEVDCASSFQGSATPSFNVGGTVMTSKGGEVYLDFKAPDAPHFSADPNDREGGWVNASVNFTGDQGSGSKKDGWLVYNDDDAGEGVGGYTPRLRYGVAPSDEKVSTAIAADPVSSVTLPPGVSGSTKADAICVVVSAVDMLGNESTLPKADADCEDAAAYKAAVADTAKEIPAGLLAGVDVDAPTIKFSPASPKVNDTTLKEFQVQVTDTGSGIRTETASVVAAASRRDAKETKKVDPEIQTQLPLATTSGINTSASVGYYTFTAHTMDKAGNASEKITRTALHDNVMPQVGVIVGSFDDKTGRYSLTATVTDNLSIKEYWAEMRFGSDGTAVADLRNGGVTITDGLFLPREGAVAVDAYNADDLTTSRLAAPFMVHTYKFLQSGATATTTASNTLASIGVVARDHAKMNSATPTANITPNLTAPDDVAGGLFDLSADAIDTTVDTLSVDQPFPAAAYKVFTSLTATAKESGGTVTLTAEAAGPLFTKPTVTTQDDTTTADINERELSDAEEGLRDNPLTRVDFYAAVDATDGGNGRTALKYIGSVNGAAAGAQDFDDPAITTTPADANDSRKYIYSLAMSKADFLAIVGGDGDYGEAEEDDADTTVDDDDEGAIVAFGVKDNKGLALYSAPVDLFVDK